MKNIYDIAVVGCGIAGASIVFQAHLHGLKTVIFEQSEISKNASSAAGAFLSPKFGPESVYNDFINRSFVYSLNFYKKHFKEFLNECGMLRQERSKEDKKKCDRYVLNSPFWIKKDNGYWCENAAVISSVNTIKKMVSFANTYKNREVKEFFYENEQWNVEGVRAKHLILCSGAKTLIKEPYLHIKAIFGQKISAKSKNGFLYSIHRKCSISPISSENVVHIGASHIPKWRYKDSEELFEQHKEMLIKEAQSILGNRLEIVNESRGFRASTLHFFPYSDEVIDTKKTLEKLPQIKSGSKFHESDFVYHKNLWIHQGHGARGFVLAPYTALLIVKKIMGEKSEENELVGLKRVFLHYVRKQKNHILAAAAQ